MRVLAVVIAILIWIIVVNVSDPIIDSTYSGIPVEIVNADYERTWSVIDNLKRITEQRIELLLHIMVHIDKMLDETDLEVSYDDIRLALDLVGNHDLEVFECVARFTEPSIKEFLASIQ